MTTAVFVTLSNVNDDDGKPVDVDDDYDYDYGRFTGASMSSINDDDGYDDDDHVNVIHILDVNFSYNSNFYYLQASLQNI